MARRNIAHVKADTIDQEPDVFRVPASHYTDPERFRLELERVWKRTPLIRIGRTSGHSTSGKECSVKSRSDRGAPRRPCNPEYGFLAALSQDIGSSASELRARVGEIVQADPGDFEAVLARLARFAAFGPPARRDVDLSALLDGLIDAQRHDLEGRQILLLRELERTQPGILGDEEQLGFALDTLLRNALRLVKARGDLYLASRFHPHGLRGAPSIRALLRFQATARFTPDASAEGSALSENALDLLLIEAIVRAQGGRFTLDASEGAETVILIDLPAPPADLA